MIAAIDAEHAVLGAAMYDPQSCDVAFLRLKPEHFSDPFNARCWETISRLWRKGDPPDPITVAGGEPERLVHLAQMVEGANVWALSSHVDMILDRAARRAMDGLMREIAVRLDRPDEPAEALLSHLERGAAEIARESTNGPSAVPVGLSALDNIEAALRGDYRGAETGLACLDRVTGGIKQDDVWFFGGRTSMGKSVICLTIARGVAQQGRGVMMFSLEMPLREVQARLVADIAHDPNYGEQVLYGDVLRGRLGHETRDRAKVAARKLASLPMCVTDAGGLTIDDIRRQALRQVRAWEKAGIKPGAVLIDHIGLVKPIRKTDSKAADTSDIVNELKGIAKELRCPIIAAAQVNRATENRSDKRPTMGDLNWSGSIEQIADFVCLLYREAYYLERGDEASRGAALSVRNKLELLIHKNRAGPIVTLDAWVDVSCNAIRDLPEDRRVFA